MQTRSTAALAAALAVAAAAHVPPTGHHLVDAPYAGAGFIGFTVACVWLLLALAAGPSRGVLAAAAALNAGAVVAYAVTRLVPLPGLAHDVGAWLDPYGVVALLAELTVVAVSLRLLARTEFALARA